jgi:hypothetical protein
MNQSMEINKRGRVNIHKWVLYSEAFSSIHLQGKIPLFSTPTTSEITCSNLGWSCGLSNLSGTTALLFFRPELLLKQALISEFGVQCKQYQSFSLSFWILFSLDRGSFHSMQKELQTFHRRWHQLLWFLPQIPKRQNGRFHHCIYLYDRNIARTALICLDYILMSNSPISTKPKY